MINTLIISILALITPMKEVPIDKQIKINDQLEIMRITPNCYLYTEWADLGSWGVVGCNGIVVVSDGKGLMVDSPMSDTQTANLVHWLEKTANVKIESFVPGHWHSDCVGGMRWLNSNGVKSYANKMTNDILKSKNRELAQVSFVDSISITVGKIDCKVYYLGGGHAVDNVVVWCGEQNILFGGCMVKDMASYSIGNIEDAAPLSEWLTTIDIVEQKFPTVRYIIPGHGKYGGVELLTHTKNVINDQISAR